MQYEVEPGKSEEFLHLMRHLGRQRRRNGASFWRLESAASSADGAVTYHEIIHYRSTTEYHRQPARMSKADLLLQEKPAPCIAATANSPAGPRSFPASKPIP